MSLSIKLNPIIGHKRNYKTGELVPYLVSPGQPEFFCKDGNQMYEFYMKHRAKFLKKKKTDQDGAGDVT